MRVTKKAAAQNRRKILETATQLFKTRGIDSVSIADLTKAAGFTHGGFYNHFESKNDLAIEAIRYAFDQSLGAISGEEVAMPVDLTRMVGLLAQYLSPEHRDDPTGGCPTGSLPVDAGRQTKGTQQAFADGLARYVELIEGSMPLGTQRKREAAIATLATLVGAMTLARAVRSASPNLSDEILRAARESCEDRYG